MFQTILISGQANSGKNILAEHLMEKLPGRWKLNAFANAVKNIFCDTFSVSREFIEEWKRIPEIPESFDLPIRQGLIHIGDGFRKIRANIWIQLAFRKQNSHQIITDGRYINESRYVRSRSGLNILLWRPGFENTINNPSETEVLPYVQHCREHRIDGKIDLKNPYFADFRGEPFPFDFFLINEGNLENFYEKCDALILPEICKWMDR